MLSDALIISIGDVSRVNVCVMTLCECVCVCVCVSAFVSNIVSDRRNGRRLVAMF